MATNDREVSNDTKGAGSYSVTFNKIGEGSIRVTIGSTEKEKCKEINMNFEKQEDGKFVHKSGHGKKTVDRMVIHGDSAILFVNMLMHKSKENSNIMAFLVRGHITGMRPLQNFAEVTRNVDLELPEIKWFFQKVACEKSE